MRRATLPALLLMRLWQLPQEDRSPTLGRIRWTKTLKRSTSSRRARFLGDRLKQRRAELEGLKAKVAVRPAVRLSKQEIVSHLAAIKRAGHVINGDPVGVRQVMRKLGIERVTVTPCDGGWDVDGLADLSRLVL